MLRVEQPERVRVGEHQAGDVLGRLGAQVVEVYPAVRRRADLDDLVAGHRHRRRVGAVGGVGREHLRAVLAAVLVVGAREQQAGQLAVRAGARLQRHVRQPGDLAQRLLQAEHQLERALGVLGVLQRVQARVAGQRRDALVQLRVVLHRARAERVEALVEVEVLRGQRRVVAHELRLGDLGQLGRRLTPCGGRQQLVERDLGHVERRCREGAAALDRAFEDGQRVGLGGSVARGGNVLGAHAGASAPARSKRPADPPPATSAARSSICAFVRRSVIATSRPSSYSG